MAWFLRLTAVTFLICLSGCRAEIEDFNLLLPATSATIHFTDFYLRGPGSIDLSGLTLSAVSQVPVSDFDDDDRTFQDDAIVDDDEKDQLKDEAAEEEGFGVPGDDAANGDVGNVNAAGGETTAGSETQNDVASTTNAPLVTETSTVAPQVPAETVSTTPPVVEAPPATATETTTPPVPAVTTTTAPAVPAPPAGIDAPGVPVEVTAPLAPSVETNPPDVTVEITAPLAPPAGIDAPAIPAASAVTEAPAAPEIPSVVGTDPPAVPMETIAPAGAADFTSSPMEEAPSSIVPEPTMPGGTSAPENAWKGGGGKSMASGNGGGGGGKNKKNNNKKNNKNKAKGGGGRERHLDETDDATYVDIVAFGLPSSCSNSRAGCDWTDLGVGNKKTDGTLRWCCSNDAISLGLCNEAQYGRLIIDKNKFKGGHYSVRVANQGDVVTHVPNGKAKDLKTGKYVVVMSNCNDEGREMLISGSAGWRSVHGYLPGELYGFMFFYAGLTIFYFILLFWYGCCMFMNENSRIPIEKWILMTIIIGLLEMLFRTGDAFVWNEEGTRTDWITYNAIGMGVVKGGVSRCLIVMVSLGWGVTRESLGRKIKWIVILGLVYVGTSLFRDLTIVIAVENMQELSTNIEQDLYDIYTILTFVVAAIDVLYVMWILDALSSTMEHLERLNQSRKLKRYLRLRCIFLFAVFFAAIWAVFAIVNSFDQTEIVEEENAWIVEASTEVNYLWVLLGVACLWRPNPNAKEYALALELGGNDENDLELTGVVPSAMDDDEEELEDERPNGQQKGVSDAGFRGPSKGSYRD